MTAEVNRFWKYKIQHWVTLFICIGGTSKKD